MERSQQTSAYIVTVNGGSSSIKLAVYTAEEQPRRLLKAEAERIGGSDPTLKVTSPNEATPTTQPIRAKDYKSAADELSEWVHEFAPDAQLLGIGHRVVHGGIHLTEHQIITEETIDQLRRSQQFDPTHLPQEIALVESFQQRFPNVPQVACFDTEFHRDLPHIAKLLPIPRRYLEAGVRRLGFHGLSYTYLLQELRRIAGPDAANGRLILAHLGSGASMTAVRCGKPLDTTMAFTPAAGLMMGTRPGDLDPGILTYLLRTERLTPQALDDLINRECGLAGISGGTSDVRMLARRRSADTLAADALDLFCYQAKKWIGAYTAVLGGLDTIVFSGGIGEHSPEVRANICDGLEAFGVKLDANSNAKSAAVISSPGFPVTTRVIPTDEEAVIANVVLSLVGRHT